MIIGPIYSTFAAEGSLLIPAGHIEPWPQRDNLLSALPRLAAAGFKTVTCDTYPGIFKSAETLHAFWSDPLKLAAKIGIKLVIGTKLHWMIPQVFGVDNTHDDLNQLFNPVGFLDWRPWQVLLDCIHRAKDTLGIDSFYLDEEYVWWTHYDSPFWISENIAQIAVDFQFFCRKARSLGVDLLHYHPYSGNTSVLQYEVITGTVLRYIAQTEPILMVPLPYNRDYLAMFPPAAVIAHNGVYGDAFSGFWWQYMTPGEFAKQTPMNKLWWWGRVDRASDWDGIVLGGD